MSYYSKNHFQFKFQETLIKTITTIASSLETHHKNITDPWIAKY